MRWGTACDWALYETARTQENSNDYHEPRCIGRASYSDTITAIMTSDMLSSYKNRAVSLIPKNAGSDVYGAIIQVMKSDLCSSYKLDAIKHICE